MKTDISKLCADYLRKAHHESQLSKLKASHARELVAAYFGYKSHAALLAEATHPVNNLDDAAILIPNVPLMKLRMENLSGLPNETPEALAIAELLSNFLKNERHYGGEIWLYESLEGYTTDMLIHELDATLTDQLSGPMAETNCSFFMPYFDEVGIEESESELVITTSGKYEGEQLDDKPFCGDTIDATVRITLTRIAGKRGFLDYDLDIQGDINGDWADPEIKYGVPNVRPKEQWLQMSGGFRVGETSAQLQNRLDEIHAIRSRIALGKATSEDINQLARLLGTEEDDNEY